MCIITVYSSTIKRMPFENRTVRIYTTEKYTMECMTKNCKKICTDRELIIKSFFCEVMAGLLNRREKELKAMLTGAH